MPQRRVDRMRFKLTIEYAGTRYSGWQIQKNAKTVQGEIDRAVREITRRKDFELYGSGRTDAGVHASAQVAHLDVVTSLPPESLRRRINDELPADINILHAAQVPHRFHARHDGADAPDRPSTLVLVDRLDVLEAGDLVLVGIDGSHFLWKMVRRIVGVLVDVGRGTLEPAAAAAFLTHSSDVPA